MIYLLDTNVVSQPGKRSPNDNLLRWLSAQNEDELRVSVLTLRELWYGVERASMRRQEHAQLIEKQTRALCAAYEGRIIPVDTAVAVAWARMLAQSHKHVEDTGLAATAAVHGLVVVTRNTDHLRGRGVTLLNPFKRPAEVIAGI